MISSQMNENWNWSSIIDQCLLSEMEIIESEKANSVTPAESSSLASSDVENFTGKIVYNPDGSAYIIEGSDGSDV